MGARSDDRAVPLPQVLDCLPGPAVVIGVDYRIAAANRAYREQYASGEDVVGRRCFEVSHRYSAPCDEAGETCPIALTRGSGKPGRALHVHFTSSGEQHEEVVTHPIPDAEGTIVSFLETIHPLEGAAARSGEEGFVGRSPAFNRMLELATRVAPTELPVLLLGESGTGKERLAQALHAMSARAGGRLVPLDCTGITESLFESELFGHEKGAFTGASQRKTGLVETCDGGTLFLDEVGDIPMPLQVKLLRLIETRTFRRVGSTEPRKSDFRLICATHRDLAHMVEQGTFRRDLFHRLSVFPIRLPPLRDRREDLPLLIESALRRLGAGDLSGSTPTPWPPSRPTRSPATCASCRTSSAGPACSPGRAPSCPSTCRTRCGPRRSWGRRRRDPAIWSPSTRPSDATCAGPSPRSRGTGASSPAASA